MKKQRQVKTGKIEIIEIPDDCNTLSREQGKYYKYGKHIFDGDTGDIITRELCGSEFCFRFGKPKRFFCIAPGSQWD